MEAIQAVVDCMERTMDWSRLVPELVVSDFETSLRFYTDVLGFAVVYRR